MQGATEQDPVWNLYGRNIYNSTKIIYMMFTATFFNKSKKERKKGREGGRKEGRKENERKNELEAFSEQGSNY